MAVIVVAERKKDAKVEKQDEQKEEKKEKEEKKDEEKTKDPWWTPSKDKTLGRGINDRSYDLIMVYILAMDSVD